jgi:hypothetical protein
VYADPATAAVLGAIPMRLAWPGELTTTGIPFIDGRASSTIR